jgi:hypothetical protein
VTADHPTGAGPAWPGTDGVPELGDLPVERGGLIAGARLAWQARFRTSQVRAWLDG